MTTPSAAAAAPSPRPSPLTRVCTVIPVLRHVRIDSIADIVNLAQINDTFRDALESYSETFWRRAAAHLETPALEAFFKRDVFAWAAHNLLTVGQLCVSHMDQHPLLVAARTGAADIVRECIAVIPDCVNVRDHRDGWTALHRAAAWGHTECVNVLLQSGADITLRTDGVGSTALHRAVAEGHAGVVRLLAAHRDFENIRDVRNSEGWTAVYYAYAFGNAEIVGVLRDANIAILDYSGRTPLHFAARKGNVGVVRQLVGGPATMHEEREGTGGGTAHHSAVSRLLEAHPNFKNIADIDSRTALHLACREGHTECAQELLFAGVDITLTDVDGFTALHYAARKGNVGVVRLLVTRDKFGAIREARNNVGETAMDVAKTEEVKQLLANNE